MALKFKTYIGILQNDASQVKYVTGYGENDRWMMWEYNKPAMTFSESTAKDYILGLALNGHAAVVIKIPDCYENIGNYNADLYNITPEETVEGGDDNV